MKCTPASPDAYRLLHEGTLALSWVEANGIRIDTDHLSRVQKDADEEIRRLQQELREDDVYKVWRKVYGTKAKLGSREQLAGVIFGQLGHVSGDTTATGRYKADESAFADIDLPFVKKYFRTEKLRKLRGTYLEGIAREVCDGFLHPSFNLNTAITYRSSSSDPNFQNIPIRNPEYAKIIRSCFVPRDGHALVEVDYSGIEVRVAACYHKDPTMLDYINNPASDMHRDMAAECYLTTQDQVTKGLRYCAKNQFVFPQFYGSVYFQCARALWESVDRMKLELADGTSVRRHLKAKGIRSLGPCDPKQKPAAGTFERHLKDVEDQFWGKRFAVYKQWKDRFYSAYLRNGEFGTKTGFRFRGLFKRNDVLNYAVQGAAFHCLLQSLVLLRRHIRKHKMKSLVVGQIHDSIIADVPLGELQDYLQVTRQIMSKVVPQMWPWVITPLDVEAEVALTNWHEKKVWTDTKGQWGPN